VPLPRLDKHLPPLELSPANCPEAYKPILRLWSENVLHIQVQTPEQQHDLARMICNLEPLSPPRLSEGLGRIAADLRAVAIEISMRRTFQERYHADLQAAIDAGAPPGGRTAASSSENARQVRASFEPPPAYDPSPSPSPNGGSTPLPPSPGADPVQSPRRSPRHSPHVVNPDLPPVEPLHIKPRSPQSPSLHQRTTSIGSNGAGPSSPLLLSPNWQQGVGGFALQQEQPPTSESAAGPSSVASPPRTPSLLENDTPAISLIRETLYAALADVLQRTPSLRGLVRTDPSRAYFGTVALAVLDVATTSVTSEGAIVGVLGAALTLDRCPPPLRPLMAEFGALSKTAKAMDEEDSVAAVQAYTEGSEPKEPRLDRARRALAVGAGIQLDDAHKRETRRSEEGTALAFANRVSALALKMTELRPFRERQEEVFRVLVGANGR
jgi:hypothetical protein